MNRIADLIVPAVAVATLGFMIWTVYWKFRIEPRAWDKSPAGCCDCGTGGPYYDGDAPQVTRYLYADWASCSAHKLQGVEPLHDFGRDVEVTFAETDAIMQAAMQR